MIQATAILLAIFALLSMAEAKMGGIRKRLQTKESKMTFTLVNADTDEDVVGALYTRYLLDMNVMPRFTLRANPDPSFPTQSIKFIVDNQEVHVENNAPYVLSGNSGKDYFPWTPFTQQGMTTFEAIPYSGKNATGVAGPARELSILIQFPF